LKTILFFLSHQPNPRFIKQINYLAQANKVVVIYFSRVALPDLNSNLDGSVRCFSMGQIESSGRYLSRFISYAKALGNLWRCRKQVRADVVTVNNIDVLLLEALMRVLTLRSPRVVLEVSDLPQYVFGRDASARLFRAIDALLVRLFVDRLIVTSKRYFEVYYASFFMRPHLELENKPLRMNVPSRIERPARGPRTIIGVVGLIYQAAPIQALFDAVKDDDTVEVQIFGRLYDAQNSKALIESYCVRQGNIVYKGSYDFFKDAARIYGGLDLLYVSYDTAESMLNNRVALPNKLYEAMYFRVPIIASRGTYLAERVLAAGVGYEIDCGRVEQIRTILGSHPARAQAFDEVFNSLPEDAYFADKDYETFARFVLD
jgi:glycosyltransferase involved in cell wall biosynthesis